MKKKLRVKHTAASVHERADAEYRKLDAMVRRLKPADFDRYAFDAEASVRWRVKDVIGHITAWKWRDVRRIAHDRSPLRPYEPRIGGTVAEENHAIYRRSHRTPAKTIVAEHRAAHRALLKALREAPPEHFARRWQESWPYDSVGHVAAHRRKHLDPLFAIAAKGPR
ncbi:MAG: maleylpyruvate isomerase N-terminal domain-containing protein [Chloroflexota bacterium]